MSNTEISNTQYILPKNELDEMIQRHKNYVEKIKVIMNQVHTNQDLANVLGVHVSEIPKICGPNCTLKYYPEIKMRKDLDAFDCEPNNMNENSAMARFTKLIRIIEHNIRPDSE